MTRFLWIGGLAVAATLTQFGVARAEFFRLDGRFQCIESGAAICGDAQPVVKPPAAVSIIAPEPAEKPKPPIVVPAAAPAVAPVPVPPRAAPKQEVDPLQVVAARVQARRPSSNDIAWLAHAADAGNPRAIELLAWCKLNAIGMGRDPVEAYLLYGAAGNASLPHARENQRLIFERDLDSHQRQQVLDLANEGVALARIMPSAR